MDKTEEILEIVSFMKDHMATKEDLAELESRLSGVESRMATKEDLEVLKTELKRDMNGAINRLDNELDKRKALEVRVVKLEAKAS